MSAISSQLFAQDSTLKVREVTLSDQDSLQSYREKLARILLEEMYQFVGLLDARGMTLEINRAALEGAGIKLSDIQHKPFWEARWFQSSKETREKQRELCSRAANGEFLRCDLEIYGKSSGEETIIVDFSIMPVRDHAGKVVFLVAEGRNITEKKVAEAEIARKNEELQKLIEQIRHLDQLKSDLFANVSHELRTPLALILGPAESVLASGKNLTDVQRRDIAVIRHNAATLLKHVNDLLDLAKLDAGRMTMDYVDVDLARMVRTVAAHFDALAPQKSISYAVLTDDAARAQVDPEKMERVLLNLLSNAFKFTPHGGRIQCALKIDDGSFILTVQDSGPGIPAAMRNSIFERFRQAQGGTTREFGGTGLGLSIVKDFVDLHGGTVSISDAPTGGAMVQVKAPLRAPEGSFVRTLNEAESAPTAGIAIVGAVEELRPGDDQVPVSGAEGKAKILVIEDHPEMRRFIAEVLSSEYHVITAADGLEGLSSVAVERPDLVVTDLMMPKLGGDEVVRRMRTNKNLMQLPVLVLSARADDELRLKLLAELAQDYLVKPFSAGELRARVRNLVTMKLTRDLLQQELASHTEDVACLTRELILNKRSLEESLKLSSGLEGKIRRLVEANVVGIFMWNLEGAITEANQAFLQMVQYNQDDITAGRVRWKDLTPAEWRKQDERAIAELMASGIFKPFEKEFFRKDGSKVSVLLGGALFEDGGMDGVAFILDLTEQKRAEEALRRSEADLAEGQKLSRTGTWRWNIRSGKVTWSQEFFAILGYDPERDKASYDLHLERIHPEDRSKIEEGRWAAIRERRHFEAEYRLLIPGGLIKCLHCVGHCLVDQSGDVEYIGAVMDITERKRDEEERERLRQAHRIVVQTATDAMVTADESGTIRFANPAIMRVFGYDPEELVGKSLTVLMPEYLRKAHENGFRQYLATGHRHLNWQGTQLTGMRKNGQEFPVEVSFGEQIVNGQRIFTGFIRDTTERRQAEEARERLRRVQTDLEHLTRVSTMGELTASLAHEINQPLTAITNNGSACLRLLANQNLSPEILRRALGDIVADGNRASAIIARIRGFIKKAPAEKSFLDVNELIHEVLALVGPELHKNQVAVKCELGKTLAPVCADRVQIQQVLLNLIMNGIEATAGVTDRSREIVVQSKLNEGGELEVAVSDSGTGLRSEEDGDVFTPFFTTKVNGMGMGLPISRSLVEGHGGRLWATRNSPYGAVFSFTMPIAESTL